MLQKALPASPRPVMLRRQLLAWHASVGPATTEEAKSSAPATAGRRRENRAIVAVQTGKRVDVGGVGFPTEGSGESFKVKVKEKFPDMLVDSGGKVGPMIL